MNTNEAETIARVTGSVSATVTHEHRDSKTGELVTDSVETYTKSRCYREFCCNTATFEVVVEDRSGTGRTPIPWGWCEQHKHHSWTMRQARA